MTPARQCVTLLAATLFGGGAAFAQDVVPVGNFQSATSETITWALHPILTRGELYLNIDVSKDGRFGGEWGEYFCAGGSPYFSCRLSAKNGRVSGKFAAGGQGVIDLGQRGSSTFTWSTPTANDLTIVLPRNWQGAEAILHRARMTRDGKGNATTTTPTASDTGPVSSAVALYREFKKDENAALKRHAGKRLVLDGRRGVLIQLSDGGAAIHVADGFTSRALVLVFKDGRQVSGIAEDAPFRFSCVVEGFDYQYVHLQDCSIVR